MPSRPPLLTGLFLWAIGAVAMPMAQPASSQQPLARLLWAANPARLSAAEPPDTDDPAALEFFERRVRPLLIANCHECHGEKQQKGGLRLDSHERVLAGGDTGPAVVPGEPEESLLIDAVRYGQIYQMPPKGKLADDEIATLVEWVRLGAPWPRSEPEPQPMPASADQGPLFTDEQKTFWAFQPPADPPLPAVQNVSWPRSPLDFFVLAPLEQRGLSPAPPADQRTLLRRATFDLTGLPPTPAEVEAFLADDSPQAFALVVERLLASPHYGERWGRHWLDVARYADSNGLDENLAYVNAFRYRDYVVKAVNQDKPYDQFVVEQLAGDLLPPTGDVALDHERLVATGFLTLGAKMLAEDDPVKMEMDIIDEQIDTIGGAFMGLTLGCARCHDHKFDPIPSADYYALAGIFKSTRTMDNFTVVATWHERPLAPPDEVARGGAHMQRLAEKKSQIEARTAAATAVLVEEARRQAPQYLLAAALVSGERPLLEPLMAGAQGEPAEAALVVEAERFDRGNVKIDLDGYGAGIGVIYNKGELPNVAEYDFELPAGGIYQIELRYAAAESRPVQLTMDAVPLRLDAAREVTGTWYADSQGWFAEALCELKAGTHVLRLERDGPFPHFDRLALVPRTLPAGVKPTDLMTPAQVAAERQLNPAFLERWIKALAAAGQNPQSPLYAWHIWHQAAGADPSARPASPILDLVFQDPRPSTADELAARYSELFATAEQAWRLLKENPDTAPADRLPDPALEALRQVLYNPQGPCAAPENSEQYFPAETAAELAGLKDELAALERQAPPALPQAMAVEDREVTNVRLHIRGSHLTLGDEVPRRFPRIIAGEDQPPLGGDHSGRLELAQWLTRPDHPLTSRVMVNRIWQGHFGAGLVRTPDNFGRLGERPTNQPLLDWLARRFVESGWSIKAMHRLIMLSAAYQMSTEYNSLAAEADPDNRLFWRMNRRRLEAELIRDWLLAASGQLDLTTMGGSLLVAKPREYVAGTASVNNTNYESDRRSIYLPVVRSALYEVFQAFDFAEPSVINGSRASTTVAPQALFMMNSRIVSAAAQALADRLLAQVDLDDGGRVQSAYQRAFGRPATGAETARALEFATRLEAGWEAEGIDAAERRRRAWQSLCRVLMASSEFVYIE